MIENINRNCVGADNNENLLKLSILFGFVSRVKRQLVEKKKTVKLKESTIASIHLPRKEQASRWHTHREREREGASTGLVWRIDALHTFGKKGEARSGGMNRCHSRSKETDGGRDKAALATSKTRFRPRV